MSKTVVVTIWIVIALNFVEAWRHAVYWSTNAFVAFMVHALTAVGLTVLMGMHYRYQQKKRSK